jgi:hypothetical protein
MVAPFLTAIGVLGLRSRYGNAIGAGGSNTLLVTTIAGLGLTSVGIVGEAFDLFGRFSDTPFMLLMWGTGVIMFSLALFGFMALSRKPLPRWNGLPVAAGIIFPFMLFLGLVLNMVSEFTVAVGIGTLIQLVSMMFLGFILQGDVTREETVMAAA